MPATSSGLSASQILYFSLVSLHVLVFITCCTVLFKIRGEPPVVKRLPNLLLAACTMAFIFGQLSLFKAFPNLFYVGRTFTGYWAFLDVAIVATCALIWMALHVFRIFIFINEEFSNQQLLNLSSMESSSKKKFQFTSSEYLFLRLFGFRVKIINTRDGPRTVLDFSNAGINYAVMSFLIKNFITATACCVFYGVYYAWNPTLIEKNYTKLWLFFGGIACFFLAATVYFITRMKHICDPYLIRNEHSTLIIIIWILLPLYIWSALDSAFYDFFLLTGITPSILMYITTILYQSLSVAFPLYCIFNRNKSRKQFKLTKESFITMFADKSMWKAFKKSLAKDFCIENGLFVEEYMKIVHVGGGLHNSIPREGLPQDLEISISKSKNTNLLPIVCNNANDLYDVFVKKNSLFELNISFHTRCTVEELFSEGKLTLSSLEPIYREVMNNMFANTYPRFLAETLDT